MSDKNRGGGRREREEERERERGGGGGGREREKVRLGAWVINLIIKKGGEGRGVGRQERNVLTINKKNPSLRTVKI